MTTSHAIVVPFPAQGHVTPMLELSRWLAKHGIKVTFVNTHFNHHRVVAAAGPSSDLSEAVSMVSIPDGLEEWEDRELRKLTEAMVKVVPDELVALCMKLNQNVGPEITCVITDWTMAWAVDKAAERFGLRAAVFCPAAAVSAVACFRIPELVADGVYDDDGRPLKNHMITTSPPFNSDEVIWAPLGDEATTRVIFSILVKGNHFIKSTDWIVCNSSHDLEAATFSSYPRIKPIGPLLATNRLAKSAGGSFWAEDSSCLSWLDQHPLNSVIYAAFGSMTVLDSKQFQELALGLELTGRPFLLVVRPDMTAGAYGAYLEGLKERVGGRGRVVEWAPQQLVLSHPSVACFVSHCGWNSTMEGVSNGVPFLCWPYFADQFLNRNYICDEWKIGLELRKDENGIITRGEVREKVEIVVGDGGYKERILNLQTRVMDSVRGGRSHANFTDFVDWINSIA